MDYEKRSNNVNELNERKPSASTPLFAGKIITNCWVDNKEY